MHTSSTLAEAIDCDDLGAGPPVLLVHDVAFGPAAFACTAEALRPHARVIVAHRRGYGRSPGRPAGARPEDHAADLVALLDRLDIERVTGVGVSGGATILAAFAIANPERCAAMILHEPALGPLAPGVHALCARLARTVSASPSPAVGADLVASTLVGPETWGSLGTAGRAEVRRSAAVVRQEMSLHAHFAPTAIEVAGMGGIPLIAAVGARSGPERREAAGVLVRLAGAATVLVPGAGNVPHLENPLALVTLITTQVAAAAAAA